MGKTLLLHDLPPEAPQAVPGTPGDYTLFPAQPTVYHCTGCFGCWLKTPGRCLLNDRGDEFAMLVPRHSRLVIISRLVFGGLSPDVKALWDRSIALALPFFRSVNGETHHPPRYEDMPELCFRFYGQDMDERDVATARRLASANALNFAAPRYSVAFYPSYKEAWEAR